MTRNDFNLGQSTGIAQFPAYFAAALEWLYDCPVSRHYSCEYRAACLLQGILPPVSAAVHQNAELCASQF